MFSELCFRSRSLVCVCVSVRRGRFGPFELFFCLFFSDFRLSDTLRGINSVKEVDTFSINVFKLAILQHLRNLAFYDLFF